MSQRYVIRSAVLLIVVVPTLFDPGSQAMAQTACTQELSNATQAYTFGRFDEAITLLNRCLKKRGVVQIEQQRSHRLLALSYIGKDEPSQARASVRNLVSQAPDYQPDPEQDPPPFVEMVEEVQREIEQVADPVPQETPQEEQGQEDTRLDALVAQARSLTEAGNDRDALPLFREAAEQGHAEAQYSLGFMYREGRIVERSYAEALTWFRKAAEQGQADAQFYVGYMYWRGEGGVASDDAEAVTWYCKAAAQEHVRAQRALTRLGKDC